MNSVLRANRRDLVPELQMTGRDSSCLGLRAANGTILGLALHGRRLLIALPAPQLPLQSRTIQNFPQPPHRFLSGFPLPQNNFDHNFSYISFKKQTTPATTSRLHRVYSHYTGPQGYVEGLKEYSSEYPARQHLPVLSQDPRIEGIHGVFFDLFRLK